MHDDFFAISTFSTTYEYQAYKKSLEVRGREKRIRGLEKYNNEQMFFIGYATQWCGHSTPFGLVNQILTDVHSPNRYR
ncbi:hypothetical protein COOONC_21378 [Cooperia oncophora]